MSDLRSAMNKRPDKLWAEENLPNPETLEQAIRERNNWCETAQQHCRNEDYYRGLVIKIGKMLGPEAYISDDGSVQEDVLCAKVPELVAQRLSVASGEGNP